MYLNCQLIGVGYVIPTTKHSESIPIKKDPGCVCSRFNNHVKQSKTFFVLIHSSLLYPDGRQGIASHQLLLLLIHDITKELKDAASIPSILIHCGRTVGLSNITPKTRSVMHPKNNRTRYNTLSQTDHNYQISPGQNKRRGLKGWKLQSSNHPKVLFCKPSRRDRRDQSRPGQRKAKPEIPHRKTNLKMSIVVSFARRIQTAGTF